MGIYASIAVRRTAGCVVPAARWHWGLTASAPSCAGFPGAERLADGVASFCRCVFYNEIGVGGSRVILVGQQGRRQGGVIRPSGPNPRCNGPGRTRRIAAKQVGAQAGSARQRCSTCPRVRCVAARGGAAAAWVSPGPQPAAGAHPGCIGTRGVAHRSGGQLCHPHARPGPC